MGLSRDDILNPTGTITADQAYELTVTSTKGCIAKDTIRLEVFKGSGVYVPTAFTPNGNGLNEVLRPGYKAIKKLSFFTIYNRWGQVVFTTTDPAKGWMEDTKASLPIPAPLYGCCVRKTWWGRSITKKEPLF
jgi:gliding motility-associated-like protein